MSKRINHTKRADQHLLNATRLDALNADQNLAAAQAEATLALAEQQRIANLVALAKIAGRDEDIHESVAEAAYGAMDALIATKIVPNGHMDPYEVEVLRPEIAAALGIEVAS